MAKYSNALLNPNELSRLYDIEEFFPCYIDLIWNERPGWKKKVRDTPLSFNHLHELYSFYTTIKYNREIKHNTYQLLKKVSKEKMFELFENQKSFNAFLSVLKSHFYWSGNIEKVSKKSRNPYKQVLSIINALYCKYNPPEFMYNLWFPEEREEISIGIELDWFVHIGQGKSHKKLSNLHFPYTAKTAHAFINSPKDLSIKQAITHSISIVNGGNSTIASMFYNTSVTRSIININPNVQKFNYDLIVFFSKLGMFDPTNIPHIIDYINHVKQNENPNWSIKGKSIAGIMRATNIWQRQLIQQAGGGRRLTENNKRSLELNWEGSGKPLFSITKKDPLTKQPYHYKIIELKSGLELMTEGRLLSHCVFSYTRACKSGDIYIFSLRNNQNNPILTIEVTKQGLINQVKGKGNRSPIASENAVIVEWANKNNFVFSKYSI